MAQLIHIEFQDLPELAIVGKALVVSMDHMEPNPVPPFWSRCFGDGTFAAIEKNKGFMLDDAYAGWMADWTGEGRTFTYLCGMLVKPGCPVPDGQIRRKIGPCTVAIGWIQGEEQEVYPAAHEMTRQALQEAGYTTDDGAGWCMEYYQCPRFTTPDEQGRIILDYYIPVVRKP